MPFRLVKYNLWMILATIGCAKTSIIDSNVQPAIAVLADLKDNSTARVHLSLVSPNGSNMPSQPLHNHTGIYITDEYGIKNKLQVENPVEGFFWIAPNLMINKEKTYSLEIHADSKIITSQTLIPKLPEIETSTTGSSVNTFKTKIKSEDSKLVKHLIISIQTRKYQVEGSTKVYTSDWQPIESTSSDSDIDNNKFGEIKAPFTRIYLKTSAPKEVVFAALQEQQDDEVYSEYRISIKAVSEALYYFLYTYDAQSNLDFVVDAIPPASSPGNISNGIGVFGGSTEKIYLFD